MTEEEYFRKNYPDSCYGDKPLSPHWDFFQDGVEFGERQSEKRIEELEQENAELRAKVTALENANRAMVKELDDMASNGLNIFENVVTNKEQLTKAKELLEKLLLVSCNSEVLNQYPNCSKVLQARVEAEQFLFG